MQNRRQEIECATVDSFQGRQNTIMIVHFVAAFQNEEYPFGHVAKTRRVCVATTRAQEYQFLFGNIQFWEQMRSTAKKNPHKKIYQLVDWVNNEHQVIDWRSVGR